MNKPESARSKVSMIAIATAVAVVSMYFAHSIAPIPESPTTPAASAPHQTTLFPTVRHAGVSAPSQPRTIDDQLNDVLANSDHVSRLTEFKTMLTDWASRDPDAALAYVQGMKMGPEHTEGVLIVLRAIGNAEPDRAILLANAMVKDKEQAIIYNSLFAKAANTDITKAVRAFAFVPPGDGRNNALQTLSSRWASTDTAAALNWANTLADDRERNLARESAIEGVLTTDPAEAIALAQKNLTGDARENVCSTAIHLLCQRDPTAARDAFNQLDEESRQPFLASEIARALAGKDLDSAITWADTLPEGSSREAAVNFINRVSAQSQR